MTKLTKSNVYTRDGRSQLNIHLPRELHVELRLLAAERDISVSELVRPVLAELAATRNRPAGEGEGAQ